MVAVRRAIRRAICQVASVASVHRADYVRARSEGWPSGLRRTPGERVGALPLVGSNPTPSASSAIGGAARPGAAERALHKMGEGAAHRILGQACETKRSSAEAEAHFQRSLGVLRAIQSRPELAQSLLAYGRFKLRDDPAEGGRLLRDALALFEEMDATGWIEETRAALDASN
jgi:hypothetical protein